MSPHARLLDLVLGRTGKVFGDWLTGRGKAFCAGVKVVTLDPFRGTVSPQAPDGTGLLLVHPISPRYRVGMGVTHISETLRRRRQDAGLSQRDLALRSGVPQPNIAAYESGRRAPAAATLERLDGVLNIPTFERLRVARELIIRAAEGRRLSDVRVFGSVARGDAGAGSDVDLLVHPGPEASVFDLAGFMAEVEELLGIRVDVVSDRGHGPVMDRIREAAVAL